MPNHVSPLDWPDADFATVLTKLDHAFAVGAAAFYYDTESGSHLLDVFEPKRAGFTVREWRKWRAGVAGLDQFLVFAFENTPDEVVHDWASQHKEGSGDVAVRRVEQMRAALEAAGAEWHRRFTGFGSILGDLEINVVYNPSASAAQAHLRIDSFVAGGATHVPIMSSRLFLQAVASRNEVQRLISRLQAAIALMPDFDLDSNDDPEEAST